MTSLGVLPAVIPMTGVKDGALEARRPLAGKRGRLQDCGLILNVTSFPPGLPAMRGWLCNWNAGFYGVNRGVGISEAEVTNDVGLPSRGSFFDHCLDPFTTICYSTYLFQY